MFTTHNIMHSNIADIAVGSPISIDNLIVHFMSKGDKYNLSERKLDAVLNIAVED